MAGMWLFKMCAFFQFVLCAAVAVDELPDDGVILEPTANIIDLTPQQIDLIRTFLTSIVPFANTTPTEHIPLQDAVLDEVREHGIRKRKLQRKERAELKKFKAAAAALLSSRSAPSSSLSSLSVR